MEVADVNSNATLREYLEESHCEIWPLGTVAGGFEMVCAIAGGTREPAIVITAGAHADEIAGVHAALILIRELRTDHRVYIVPVRDPFGFEGYRANLQFALGFAAQIESPGDIYGLLRKYGEVLYERNTYILAQVGDYVFAYDVGVDFPTSSVGRRIDTLVRQDQMLLERLAAVKRVIAPWALPMPRYGDPYRQGTWSVIVKADGLVGDLNRFFDLPDAPPEVQCPRNLVDEVRPGLVLDLHEGYGRGFYVYKPQSEDPLANRIASAMGSAVRARGGQTATPEELQPYWGPNLGRDREYFGNGVFYSGASTRSSFGDYNQARTIAFTLETGGLNPVNWRADLHTWAALAAIEVWEAARAEG